MKDPVSPEEFNSLKNQLKEFEAVEEFLTHKIVKNASQSLRSKIIITIGSIATLFSLLGIKYVYDVTRLTDKINKIELTADSVIVNLNSQIATLEKESKSFIDQKIGDQLESLHQQASKAELQANNINQLSLDMTGNLMEMASQHGERLTEQMIGVQDAITSMEIQRSSISNSLAVLNDSLRSMGHAINNMDHAIKQSNTIKTQVEEFLRCETIILPEDVTMHNKSMGFSVRIPKDKLHGDKGVVKSFEVASYREENSTHFLVDSSEEFKPGETKQFTLNNTRYSLILDFVKHIDGNKDFAGIEVCKQHNGV